MLGGDGIIFDNYAMKAYADMEALYTYEGTYDINSLVAARELTGIAAFKVPKKNWQKKVNNYYWLFSDLFSVFFSFLPLYNLY